MSATNFNTSNQTLRQLLGNGLSYHIPRFQRDYSWTQDEWEDLWEDIKEMDQPQGEPAHYMGYLVLQTKDSKNFDVIDGQQRLTTLSLLVLAVLRALQDLVQKGENSEENQRRIEQLRSTYIGFLDPVSLVSQPKLTLNRNNDSYYRDYLMPLGKPPKTKIRHSEKLLGSAYEWFYNKLKPEETLQKSGKALAQFLDSLSDRLFFTVITVTDELNAFKVFETLNARGVRLSPTDLLKNYLFSIVFKEKKHEQEIDELERRWDTMIGRLSDEKFPNFLRMHWNSRHGFVREGDLFKRIRSKVADRAEAFRLLHEMDSDVEVYGALSDSESNVWTDDQRKYVRELKLYGIRQPWPLLLAAARALDAREFGEVLRTCSIISLRYNVIGGMATGEQERAYNQIAQKIASGELTSANAIIRALSGIYPKDSAFLAAFENKTLKTTDSRNKKVVRHILFALERHLSGRDLDTESAQYTIEHILPENPSEEWRHFGEDQAGDAVYRLGNMTILEQKPNKIAGNSSFTAKKAIYQDSDLTITQLVARDNSEWNFDRLANRQRWMAKQATAIWRIDQLS